MSKESQPALIEISARELVSMALNHNYTAEYLYSLAQKSMKLTDEQMADYVASIAETEDAQSIISQ